MRAILLLTTLAMIAGCSATPTIQRVSDSKSAFDDTIFTGEKSIVGKSTRGVEEYRVFHQGRIGFASVASAKEYAMEKADAFCGKQNKTANTISEQATMAPYLFLPKVEIVFSCVEKPKNTVVSSNSADQYTQLRDLKLLLDDRVLTPEEFQVEKRKILSR